MGDAAVRARLRAATLEVGRLEQALAEARRGDAPASAPPSSGPCAGCAGAVTEARAARYALLIAQREYDDDARELAAACSVLRGRVSALEAARRTAHGAVDAAARHAAVLEQLWAHDGGVAGGASGAGGDAAVRVLRALVDAVSIADEATAADRGASEHSRTSAVLDAALLRPRALSSSSARAPHPARGTLGLRPPPPAADAVLAAACADLADDVNRERARTRELQAELDRWRARGTAALDAISGDVEVHSGGGGSSSPGAVVAAVEALRGRNRKLASELDTERHRRDSRSAPPLARAAPTADSSGGNVVGDERPRGAPAVSVGPDSGDDDNGESSVRGGRGSGLALGRVAEAEATAEPPQGRHGRRRTTRTKAAAVSVSTNGDVSGGPSDDAAHAAARPRTHGARGSWGAEPPAVGEPPRTHGQTSSPTAGGSPASNVPADAGASLERGPRGVPGPRHGAATSRGDALRGALGGGRRARAADAVAVPPPLTTTTWPPPEARQPHGAFAGTARRVPARSKQQQRQQHLPPADAVGDGTGVGVDARRRLSPGPPAGRAMSREVQGAHAAAAAARPPPPPSLTTTARAPAAPWSPLLFFPPLGGRQRGGGRTAAAPPPLARPAQSPAARRAVATAPDAAAPVAEQQDEREQRDLDASVDAVLLRSAAQTRRLAAARVLAAPSTDAEGTTSSAAASPPAHVSRLLRESTPAPPLSAPHGRGVAATGTHDDGPRWELSFGATAAHRVAMDGGTSHGSVSAATQTQISRAPAPAVAPRDSVSDSVPGRAAAAPAAHRPGALPLSPRGVGGVPRAEAESPHRLRTEAAASAPSSAVAAVSRVAADRDSGGPAVHDEAPPPAPRPAAAAAGGAEISPPPSSMSDDSVDAAAAAAGPGERGGAVTRAADATRHARRGEAGPSAPAGERNAAAGDASRSVLADRGDGGDEAAGSSGHGGAGAASGHFDGGGRIDAGEHAGVHAALPLRWDAQDSSGSGGAEAATGGSGAHAYRADERAPLAGRLDASARGGRSAMADASRAIRRDLAAIDAEIAGMHASLSRAAGALAARDAPSAAASSVAVTPRAVRGLAPAGSDASTRPSPPRGAAVDVTYVSAVSRADAVLSRAARVLTPPAAALTSGRGDSWRASPRAHVAGNASLGAAPPPLQSDGESWGPPRPRAPGGAAVAGGRRAAPTDADLLVNESGRLVEISASSAAVGGGRSASGSAVGSVGPSDGAIEGILRSLEVAARPREAEAADDAPTALSRDDSPPGTPLSTLLERLLEGDSNEGSI